MDNRTEDKKKSKKRNSVIVIVILLLLLFLAIFFMISKNKGEAVENGGQTVEGQNDLALNDKENEEENTPLEEEKADENTEEEKSEETPKVEEVHKEEKPQPKPDEKPQTSQPKPEDKPQTSQPKPEAPKPPVEQEKPKPETPKPEVPKPETPKPTGMPFPEFAKRLPGLGFDELGNYFENDMHMGVVAVESTRAGFILYKNSASFNSVIKKCFNMLLPTGGNNLFNIVSNPFADKTLEMDGRIVKITQYPQGVGVEIYDK